MTADNARDDLLALEVTGLRHAYDREEVLHGVDLRAETGSIVAVLGPSGCGKTTLLRLVAGFERPTAGSIRLGGQPVTNAGTFVAPERRRVGIVPQEGALFPHLDVAGNVGFGLTRAVRRDDVGGRSGDGRPSDRTAECLALVGMSGFERRRPAELSGGQQQRVAIARALAPRPTVILLDEPFSSLDAGLRAGVRIEVTTAIRHDGATALVVTHDRAEALSMADRVVVLLDGRVAQVGTPEEVYRRPVSFDVARFVGESVVIPGTASNASVVTALGTLPLADPEVRGEVDVVLRPEQIVFSTTDDATAAVKASVTSVAFSGASTEVHAVLPDRSGTDGPVAVRSEVPGATNLRPGDTVAVSTVDAALAYPRADRGQPGSTKSMGGDCASQPATSRDA